MTDELSTPQVPDAKPDDPEDVSWALSTAEAMWARGDHAEGLKWVRRAAEAASEAENDNRALELAKAAADLQAVVTRMSQADKGSDRALSKPPAKPPPLDRNAAPPTSRSVPPTSRSVPPIGRASTKPEPPRGSAAPPVPTPASNNKPSGRSIPPIGVQGRASTAPKPLPAKAPEKKGRRKSRENLDDEAKAAGVLDTARHPAVTSDTDEIAAVRGSLPSDSTLVAHRDEIDKRRKTSRSAAEWDAIATANLTGADVMDDDDDSGDRKTTIGGAAAGFATSPSSSRAPPRSVPPRAAPRSPSIVPHDQSIQTSQAVRVVVWRDANGVHVAPAGTVVSAIKIDAVLVALEPTADLTAWLSPKTR